MSFSGKIKSYLNKSNDLSLQIFILITASYFVLILSILIYRYQNLKSIQKSTIEKNMKTVSKVFSSSLGKSVFEKKKDLLLENLAKILKNNVLTGVKITDPLRNHIESSQGIKR